MLTDDNKIINNFLLAWFILRLFGNIAHVPISINCACQILSYRAFQRLDAAAPKESTRELLALSDEITGVLPVPQYRDDTGELSNEYKVVLTKTQINTFDIFVVQKDPNYCRVGVHNAVNPTNYHFLEYGYDFMVF